MAASAPRLLSKDVKAIAGRLGFDACGVSRAQHLDEEAGLLESWLSRGYHGTMGWMEQNVEKRVDPRKLVPGARSVISLVLNYYQGQPARPSQPDRSGDTDAETALFSRYAWGDDYHEIARERMFLMFDELDRVVGGLNGRVFVDSAPIMDKVWAQRSGLGWIGKHTNLISTKMGSWFFLGQIVTDLELEPDGPIPDHCGSCTRCIDACPTDAIVEPYVVDANRCISYLTIEHRSDDIPSDLQPDMKNWVFGCDICQDVCPVNRKAQQSLEPAFRQRHDFAAPALIPLLDLDDEGFRERFRNSPVKRAKRVGLQRNVCVALGNIGDSAAVPALTRALHSGDVVVRSHAAWALGRIQGKQAANALESALEGENSSEVIEEINLALAELNATANVQ